MSQLLRFYQCLLLTGGWQLAAVSLALAQPTLISERKHVPRWPEIWPYKSLELPGRRFVHCGDMQVDVSPTTGKYELAFVVSTFVGDTVRYRRLNVNPARTLREGDHFTDVVLGPDHTLTFLSRCFVAPANPAQGYNDPGYALTNVDTLGAVRWRRTYPLYPIGSIAAIGGLLRVPDGYLVTVGPVSPASTPTTTYTQGGLAKFDLQGALLWQRTWPSRGYAGVAGLGGLVPRPDGSYLATGLTDNGTPYAGGPTSPRFDHWLVQFTPQGDTIRTARFGTDGVYETGRTVANTAGGGALVSGVRFVGGSRGTEAQLVQVDSLLRPQWTYTQPNTSNTDESFYFAQPLRGGDVVFGGGRFIAATRENYGYLTRFTAAGTQRWTWQHHYANNAQNLTGYFSLVGQPDSSAYLAGGYRATYSAAQGEMAFAHVGNVGAPYVADLCRVLPRAVVAFGFTAGGDSLRLASFSTPGPRYAALALWHWDFGDGTFFDGPTPPPHRYAGAPGAGTRVALTVTNNLGCTSTQVVFPFALATAPARAQAAGARLWPNPAAGAAVLEVPGLRAQPPMRLEVVNALGQVLAGQTVAVRQGAARAEVDLRALPAGVYALRLHAQEGTVVKRLVKE